MKPTAVLARQSGSPAPKRATSWSSHVQSTAIVTLKAALPAGELSAWGFELQLSDVQMQELEPWKPVKPT